MHFGFMDVILLHSGHHPEDGHMNGRNMLVTTIQYSYIPKTEMRLLVF